jgi:hypothetical protein
VVKEVYNPKAFIPHAASLRQASAHCAIFPTAASRRSLGRVSVPVWPVALSGRLPVIALVGRHPTNKLIGREPIPDRKENQPFHPHPCEQESYPVLDPVSRAYPRVRGRLLTCYSPVRRSCTPKGLTARLACVKHAASVRPEPGSNSPSTVTHQPHTHTRTRGGKPETEAQPQPTTPTHTEPRRRSKEPPPPLRRRKEPKQHKLGCKDKQTRAVEFSRNNRRPSTRTPTHEGLFPSHGNRIRLSTPPAARKPPEGTARSLPAKPSAVPLRSVLNFTGFLQNRQIGVSEAFPEEQNMAFAAISSRHTNYARGKWRSRPWGVGPVRQSGVRFAQRGRPRSRAAPQASGRLDPR